MEPSGALISIPLEVLLVGAILTTPLQAQVSLQIGAGDTLRISNAINLDISGNWTNSGRFIAGNGRVTFNGTSGTQTIVNASGEVFYHLVLNKAAGIVQLMSPITVNGTATLTSGDLNLNGNVLTLGPAGAVSETPGNTIYCGTTGYIIAVRPLNAPTAENVGGLGAFITTSADLGSTTVKRSHSARTGGGNSSIRRSFTVVPTNNFGLNATLTFRYDHTELDGLSESELTLFRSTDDGETWVGAGGTLDTTNNTISLAGINSFSLWTAAASSAPLPVQFVSLAATSNRLSVELKWSTATEVDNSRFEIERRKVADNSGTPLVNSPAWTMAGSVSGSGTSSFPREYSFVDKLSSSGRYSYRIKQINKDGSFAYSTSLEVVTHVPLSFALSQNYPNPFNPTTTIEYDLPREVPVLLRIFDNLGREVGTLVDVVQPAGYYKVPLDAQGLSSGIYYFRIRAGDFVKARKMLVVK